MSLFAKLEPDDASSGAAPLAERMRPRTLDEFAGQQALLGPGKPLRVAIERSTCCSAAILAAVLKTP